jgi:beta-phosphoglucomutase
MDRIRARFDALLFDLDGTLIDSMPIHQRAWARWFDAQGLPFDEAGFFAATAGRTNAEILGPLLAGASAEQLGAQAEAKEALYRELAAQELQAVAGALALLVRARAQGFALAICTAAPEANIELAMRRFGLDQLVDVVTSPADGLRGKPHPDIFEAAAARLGVSPERCLVFEDAPLGLEAAHRAGMAVVALTTSLPPAAFEEFPNRIATVNDLTLIDDPLLFT